MFSRPLIAIDKPGRIVVEYFFLHEEPAKSSESRQIGRDGHIRKLFFLSQKQFIAFDIRNLEAKTVRSPVPPEELPQGALICATRLWFPISQTPEELVVEFLEVFSGDPDFLQRWVIHQASATSVIRVFLLATDESTQFAGDKQ